MVQNSPSRSQRRGIYIDNVLLVDSATLARTAWYLPFDPAAEGLELATTGVHTPLVDPEAEGGTAITNLQMATCQQWSRLLLMVKATCVYTFPEEVSGELELYANVGSAISAATLKPLQCRQNLHQKLPVHIDDATWFKISGVTGVKNIEAGPFTIDAQDKCRTLGYQCRGNLQLLTVFVTTTASATTPADRATNFHDQNFNAGTNDGTVWRHHSN